MTTKFHFAGVAAALGAAAAASSIVFAGAAGAAPSPTVNHGLGMYGNPAAAAKFWQRQHDSNCGEMSVADVVGQVTGRQPSEQQIDATAQNTRSVNHAGSIWHPGATTNNADIPVLLAHYGVQTSPERQTNMTGLEQSLAQGHKVIVGLNAEIVWNKRGDHTKEDHFVVVTGIDTRTGVVHLNDSGINSGRDEQVSIATFESAWATSQHFTVVTK